MRQDHVLDRQRMLGCEGEVLISVPLRVDDDRRSTLRIANEVGGVSEAGKIELLKNHGIRALVILGISCGSKSRHHCHPRRSKQFGRGCGVSRNRAYLGRHMSISPWS